MNQSSVPSCSSSSAGEPDSLAIEHGNDHNALFKWKIHNFSSKLETRQLLSGSIEVEGFNFRLHVYPNGGYCSIYLQIIIDSKDSKECFASYGLSIINLRDESKSITKESSNKFFHGWCDFAHISTLVDPESGFISNSNDAYIIIVGDILVLKESTEFLEGHPLSKSLDGRFTWKIHNFSFFKEKIKTQKIVSPVFPASTECDLSITLYQSNVNGIEYLSVCLESKKENYQSDQSCWCLFRMSVKTQKPGLKKNMHRDSYGRLAIDSRSGDNASLGWNDYMKMSDFIGPDLGFLVNDTAVFQASFQILKESSDFTKNGGSLGERSMGREKKSDGYIGKFTWRIDNFTRLRDLSRKRGLYDFSVKSKRFQIGDRDCRLIVYLYPRGSQSPYHLSLFLEVTDSRNTASDCSCFVSHRLSVVNQWREDKSIVKESQNRYSKVAKDWGWVNFVTFGSLFDQGAGFLVQDGVVFSAEVLILKETSEIQDFSDLDMELSNAGGQTEVVRGAKRSFTWKLENFSSFKEIMETRKIFSNFFQAGEFELRIGVYESFDTIYMCLESDQSAPDKNFWVKYKMGVVNQKNSDKTLWKESYYVFTNTRNNSVLQLMKVSDILEGDVGFILGDTIVFVCYILDCCRFEFSDLVGEFKFNPNAKSFTPPQTPIRSPSPVSDSSCYFPNNVSAVQLMQCLPMGVGIGTSFAGPRPVMYNPQAAPIQLPQALIHPNAHLSGQPMILGHYPRQGLCTPGYIVWATDDYGSSSQASPVQKMNAFELQNPNVMDSYSLEGITVNNQPDEAIGDEHNKCVMQSFLIEDETPREDESLPFVKCSPLWEIFESKDIFRATPQRLHFHPLKQFNMELREELAIDLTLSFTNIVEKTGKANIDDPVCILQGMLNALEDLKAHGFNAKPIQARLQKLLRIKEEQGQIISQLVEAEEQINEKQHEKVMLETELEEIGMEMRKMQQCFNEMKKKRNSVEVKNENQGSEIAELKTTLNRLRERVQRARLEFSSIVTDPW